MTELTKKAEHLDEVNRLFDLPTPQSADVSDIFEEANQKYIQELFNLPQVQTHSETSDSELYKGVRRGLEYTAGSHKAFAGAVAKNLGQPGSDLDFLGDSLFDSYKGNLEAAHQWEGKVNRVEDINAELNLRQVDGVIHYIQAFCHRGIGDIIFRDVLKIPMLTLEGDDDFYLTQHIKTRIEAFLDMLELGQRSQDKKQSARLKITKEI